MLQAKLKINSGSILFYPSLILYFLCFLSLIIQEIWFEGTESTMAEQSMLLASLFSLVPLGNVLQLL